MIPKSGYRFSEKIMRNQGIQTVIGLPAWWEWMVALKPTHWLALVGALLIQTSNSMAESALRGRGTLTCARFAEDYRKNPADAENSFFRWAQGFMSGHNVGGRTPGSYRDMDAMSPDAQKQYLRKYCDQHPQAEYVKGVLDLFLQFPLKRSH